MTAVAPERLVRAASLSELRAAGRLVVHLDRHTICLFHTPARLALARRSGE